MNSATTAQKKRILVIDDNAELLSLNKIILEMDDYEVYTAAGGAEALTVLARIVTPDLILLDLLMEEMSGAEFLLELEQKWPEIYNNVPVVFLTAMDKVPKSKAVGFIRKPIDIDKFLEAVRGFMEMKKS